MFVTLILYLWVAIVPSEKRHDFHSSLTEINYNPKSEALEVTMRVFTDDFEKALTTQNEGKPIRLERNTEATSQHIERYLRKHFALISPTKQVKTFSYIGSETELDATWLYFELPDCKSIKGYTLYNVVMLELFDDQTNLVNVILGDQRRSFIFNQKTKIESYPF